ncbi:MAG: CrcB family protein [Haloplanus sp.]
MAHPLKRLEALLLVAVGGAVGATLRYLVGGAITGLGGTLAANALGSVVLGFLLYEAVYADLLAEQTQLVFGTGLLSSFTTYSTFAVQTATASPPLAVGNVVANYALGFAGVLVGQRLARRVGGSV